MTTTTKKYELLKDDTVTAQSGQILTRIRALIDIGTDVKTGDLGGYIESEENLSHNGKAWVADDAHAYDDARVYGIARVAGNAQVSGSAQVSGGAAVYGNARIYGRYAIVWFSNVGSAYGTLTCYRGKDGDLLVTRGCFSGTDEKFLKAIKKKHGSSNIGHEYRLLIEVARSRLGFAASAAPAAQGES